VNDHITRYSVMPIPPVDAQTEYFDAGAVRFGVEYRLLDDAIAGASSLADASGQEAAGQGFDDRGVALHVFGRDDAGGDAVEYLRFDCFDEDPHYHYVSWRDRSNEMLHIDPIADGDPLTWALERIRTRLPQMLERAGAPEVAARVDARLVESVLPKVSEAAWRARYHHDETAVRAGALKSRKEDAA
jgi:hypothetical protein